MKHIIWIILGAQFIAICLLFAALLQQKNTHASFLKAYNEERQEFYLEYGEVVKLVTQVWNAQPADVRREQSEEDQ